MRSWSAPAVPSLTTVGPPVALHDTASATAVTPTPRHGDGTGEDPARLYVCGITP